MNMKNMKHFNSFLLLLLLLSFSALRIEAIRGKFSSPSNQVFHPWHKPPISSPAGEIYSQKRRVPTGSNPLHNKR
ncbi:hypothetical protein L6164_029123 [Bauhinia variegata]|uniref:Uncharacterized protein n=1 Tax=Bauhinia variegata TaxID=167791 RepID=A0ACB9L887_BAUVA|nr:hypothetical protein L6164_029123 [Bauhinia variegata]